jgi:outer membrane protein OmpA-like peptidoglycan-associated protein
MDTILGNDGGSKGSKTNPNPNSDSGNSNSNTPNSHDKSVEIYSKFDFVPGDNQLFYDDFSQDFVGDFPSKWNTNSGGELVTINNSTNKWLKILPGYNSLYIPNITNLPEEFTVEFDIVSNGIDNKTSSQSYFEIIVADNNSFETPKNYASVEYSFCQYIGIGITVDNRVNGKREIRNSINADIREIIANKHHISIAVNKQRFRMWINQTKYVDVPKLVPEVAMKSIKFNLKGIDINKEAIFLSNFKVAEGGVDLRRQLIEKGNFTTNGILFDSGSDIIQPQSYGIIRQISQTLQQEPSMKLKIIGHTDSDGSDDSNIVLSKKRAEAVKNALATIYNISPDRLQTGGKGESTPVADNNTADGKAKNRRVEFVKI